MAISHLINNFIFPNNLIKYLKLLINLKLIFIQKLKMKVIYFLLTISLIHFSNEAGIVNILSTSGVPYPILDKFDDGTPYAYNDRTFYTFNGSFTSKKKYKLHKSFWLHI